MIRKLLIKFKILSKKIIKIEIEKIVEIIEEERMTGVSIMMQSELINIHR